MSTQELDVKKAWRAVRRHRRVVLAVASLGLLGGLGVAFVQPPMYTATALVVLPPAPASEEEIETQVFIANSEPVLKGAGARLKPSLTAHDLRDRVDIVAITQDVIEIKAHDVAAARASTMANAVAEVYLGFVTTEQRLPGNLGKKAGARMLEESTSARGGKVSVHLALYGLLGTLAGGLAGAVVILAVARGDRRLRLRDEIADSVGIPVLASLSSYRAVDVSDWSNLFERYQPTAVDAWSLRKTLHHLNLDLKGSTPVSLAVITFAEDSRALPLGPQIAAFATSIGIPTAVVIETNHEATSALVESDPTVPSALEGSPRRLLGESTRPGDDRSRIALDVELIVVDRDNPQLAGSAHTTTTVIGLSAGSVTAEELARLVVAAAADDRTIDGLIVADPDPADRTNGRVPASAARSAGSRLPTLLTGTARRTR